MTNKIEELKRANEELKKENEELDKKAYEVAEAAKKSAGSNWYSLAKDQLNEIDDKIRANKRQITKNNMASLNVGDGVSLSPMTDWTPYTVIERRETAGGFILTIQEDNAIRIDSNGQSNHQEYRYERNPEGPTRIMTWNNKKETFTVSGGTTYIGLGRRCYDDPSY